MNRDDAERVWVPTSLLFSPFFWLMEEVVKVVKKKKSKRRGGKKWRGRCGWLQWVVVAVVVVNRHTARREFRLYDYELG